MTIVLSATIVVFGALVLLLLGAQVELYRSVQQLREYSGLLDRSIPIELPRLRTRPSSAGLPAFLDTTVSAVVLFLSDKCATCRSIAAAFDGSMPRNVVVVLDAGGDGAGMPQPPELALTYRFDQDRTVLDLDKRIADGLNVKVTPAAIVVENGRMVRGSTVPSTRQLYALLETLRVPDSPAIHAR
jgi:hypothetical protein